MRRPMFRSANKIVDDVMRLSRAGVTQVAFSHDIFTLPYAGRDDLISGVQSTKIQIGLMHEFWKLPTRETLRSVYSAFDSSLSQVSISAESGDTSVRQRNFPSKIFQDVELLDCLKELKHHRQDVEIYFVANLPFETRQTWPKTLQLMDRIAGVYGLDRLIAYCGFLTIDPQSPMWLDPVTYGVLKKFQKLDDYNDMSASGVRVPGFESRLLSNRDVIANLEQFRSHVIGLQSVAGSSGQSAAGEL